MIDSQTFELTRHLNGLEIALRQYGLWSEDRPKPEALDSTMPFCYDTLEIEQWLQFIFIGRMREILEQGDGLPSSCGISPYVETLVGFGRKLPPSLLVILSDIDNVIENK